MLAPIAWFDFTTDDPDKVGNFYQELFGWSLGPSGDDSYSLIDTGAGDGAIGGGIAKAQGGEGVGATTVYVHVDDLQSCLDKAASLGGAVVVPPTALPGDYGSFALFTDPDGRIVGLMG